MKIAVVTLGSIGDLLPFLAVGTTLRERGHDLVFASHASYESLVRMAGFPFHPIWDGRTQGHTLDDVLDSNPGEAWNRVHSELFQAATGPTFDFVGAVARRGKCVILASWSAFGARVAHEKLQIPLCSAYLSPHALAERLADRSPADAESSGAPELRIAFFPAWFSAHEPGWSPQVRTTGFPMFDDALVPALPPELERFLGEGDAPIIFTPGSFVRRSQTFFHESLAACQKMRTRAVFLTPHRTQIPPLLPPGIVHFKYVSLQKLLPRAAALVCHGGIGTCAQAMRAGIPQVVTPLFFDQFDNAARIEAMGIGKNLARRPYNRDNIAGALDDLLHSDSVRQNCLRVAALFRGANPVGEICQIVESLA